MEMIDNKHLIHIVSELCLIGGLTYFFKSKTNKLSRTIEELNQRLEDQQENIEQHSVLIKKLFEHIHQQEKIIQSQLIEKQSQLRHEHPPFEPPLARQSSTRHVQFDFKEPRDVKLIPRTEDSDSEEDLDAEIAEELEELINDNNENKIEDFLDKNEESDNEMDLKKQHLIKKSQ